jgi:hypothetical protein
VVNIFPGASRIIIGSQTVSLNGPPVTIENHGVMTFAPSGLVVINHEVTSTYQFPAVTSIARLVNTVLYNGHSLTLGSPAITIPGERIVSLSPSGILIVNNGITVTQPLPTAIPPTPTNPLLSVATVFNDQTLTLNAPATFIPGIGTISLSPSGLIIANNDITITSILPGFPPFPSPTINYPLPPTNYPLPPTTLTIANHIHTLFPLSPTVYILDDQTLALSGAVATVTENQVVSFKEGGVLVQIPGGGVTTISVASTPTLVTLSPVLFVTAPSVSRPGGGVFVGTSTQGVSSSTTGLGQVIYNMQGNGGALPHCHLWSKVLVGLMIGVGNVCGMLVII